MILFVLFVALSHQAVLGEWHKTLNHLHRDDSDSMISLRELAREAKNNSCESISINGHNDCRTTDHSKTYILPEWSNYIPGINNAVHPHKFVSIENEAEYVREIIDECQKISQEIGILVVPGEEIVADKEAAKCLLHILSPFYCFDDGYAFTGFQTFNDIKSILGNLKNSHRLSGLAHPFLDKTHPLTDEDWHQFDYIGVLHQLNIPNFTDILDKYLEENNYRLKNNLPMLAVMADNDYHKTPVEIKYLENLNSRFSYIWLENNQELNEINLLSAIKQGKTYASLGNLTLEKINYIPGVADQTNSENLQFTIKSPKPKLLGLALNYNVAVYCNGSKIYGSEVPNSTQVNNNFSVPFDIPIPNTGEKLYLIIYAFYPDFLLDKTKVQMAELITSPIIINLTPLQNKKYYCDFKDDIDEKKVNLDVGVKSVRLKKFNGETYPDKWLIISRPGELATCSEMIDRGENFSIVIAQKDSLYYVKTQTINHQVTGDVFIYYSMQIPHITKLSKSGKCIDILDWDFTHQIITILTNEIKDGNHKVFDFPLEFGEKITNVRYLSEQTIKQYQKRNDNYKLDYFDFDNMILQGQKVKVTHFFQPQFIGANGINDISIYNSTEFKSLKQHEYNKMDKLARYRKKDGGITGYFLKCNPNERIYFILNINNIKPNQTFTINFQGRGKRYRFLLDWNQIKKYPSFNNESAIFLLASPAGEQVSKGKYKLTLMQFNDNSRKHHLILEYDNVILE